MDKRKFISQVIAAILLYVIISVILEKDYSQAIIINEFKEALVFGAVFAIFIWLREKWKRKE